jgi:Domain of unknown function (DUF4032)
MLNQQDSLEFRNARVRSLLRGIWGQVTGQSTSLLAWDDVRDKLGVRGLIRRGVQNIPVAQIVGSVGRYRDFDNVFLPRSNAMSDRWRKINRAFYDDISLPPVVVYKVGDAYFVLDGNHRVSVAREHNVEYLDAEVLEASVRAPITAADLQDINADDLILLGEYESFLNRTRLDQLRPDQNLRFTIGGAYDRLIEHIAVHRYYMDLEQKRHITEDEAVTDWYDKVYMPIITAVRKDGILKEFADRTESDLYLWIIDHQHYLRENSGDDSVAADAAAHDYADRFGAKPPLERIQAALSGLFREVLHVAPEPISDAVAETKPEDKPYL